MSEQQYTAPQHFAPKKKHWVTKPLVWAPALALAVGMGIGAGTAPSEATAEPAPTPTVTVTPQPVEKRIEVKVEKTPQACLTAIDLAQQGFTYSAESMGYMNDALQAAGKFNVAKLEQANADLQKLNPKISALAAPMQAAVAECRAKG